MDQEHTTFMHWERLLFRIYLSIVGFGFVILGVMYYVNDMIREISRAFSSIVVILIASTIIYFFVSLVRMIKYYISVRKNDETATIWRSVTTFLTSPIAFIFYYVLLFIMLLSTASCTYTG
ncbi:hypothetical protein [Candidatus Xianfuyuplasma coldseepsis]|uniref:Transmembrane protein n=1 Tax=Candidatus Xianfuyuplasma coldseepsis TaxID=2782163 RepID=A0A7L7KTR4_9MOLU|nr:hypothetical protein [Xianfuyuplasma coldseepsis]QMS85819.1 hypothetical protein G4Z02_08695 [Xianfuyuplasma coldseepsis]